MNEYINKMKQIDFSSLVVEKVSPSFVKRKIMGDIMTRLRASEIFHYLKSITVMIYKMKQSTLMCC